MGGQMWMLHKMWATGVTMPSRSDGVRNLRPRTETVPKQPVNI